MELYRNVYFIGGSPCSGKSTVTEMIVNSLDISYYNIDYSLIRFIEMGALKGLPASTKFYTSSPDEIWVDRSPELMVKDEMLFYEEAFEFVLEEINENFEPDEIIITEGAMLLPWLIDKLGVDRSHYVAMIPTKQFQFKTYKERPWIEAILQSLSDRELGFTNWMNRDHLFGVKVQEYCEGFGHKLLITDFDTSIDDQFDEIIAHFNIKK